MVFDHLLTGLMLIYHGRIRIKHHPKQIPVKQPTRVMIAAQVSCDQNPRDIP